MNVLKWYSSTTGDIFYKAIRDGDLKKTKALLMVHPALISRKYSDYGTGLHLAAKRGQESIVKFLLASGAEVNAKNNDGETPLHNAAREVHARSEELVRCLLASGADVNAKDNKGRTPLRATVMDSVTRLLLDRGADPNEKDTAGDAPLHWACDKRIGLLLAKHANPNATNNDGGTPLHFTVARNYEHDIRNLLAGGADVNAADNKGVTPLHLAAKRGILSFVKLLLANGADADCRDGDGLLPYHYANDRQTPSHYSSERDSSGVRLALATKMKSADAALPSSDQTALDQKLLASVTSIDAFAVERFVAAGARITSESLKQVEPALRDAVAACCRLIRENDIPPRADPRYSAVLLYCTGWERDVLFTGYAAEAIISLLHRAEEKA